MAMLEIDGRKVEVDDKFLSLSPEKQAETVDEIAASLGIKPGEGKLDKSRVDAPTDGPQESNLAEKGDRVADDVVNPASMNQLIGSGAMLGADRALAHVLAGPRKLVEKIKGTDLGEMPVADVRQQMLAEIDAATARREKDNPIQSTLAELAGTLATSAAVPVANVFKAPTLAARAGNTALTGATFSGVEAFNKSKGDLETNEGIKQTALDTLTGIGLGAGAGAAFQPAAELLGAGAKAAIRGVLRGGKKNAAAMREGLETFEKVGEKVPASVGQLTGSRTRTAIEKGLGLTPGPAHVLANVAKKQQEKIGEFTANLSNNLSKGASAEKAGRSLKKGMQGFRQRFDETAERLYGKLDRFIAPDSTVSLQNTKQALEELTAAIPGAEGVSKALKNPKLQNIASGLLEDLQKSNSGQLPYAALKEIRSKVGKLQSSTSLAPDVDKRDLKLLYGALTQDMQAAANAAGPQAANAFMRANKHYKGGIQRIENFLNGINKKVAPEDAFKFALSGNREGGTRLTMLRKSMTKDEWKAVSASVLNRLGRAKNSSQDDVGDVFSTETFLTNWNAMSKEAKTALFSNQGTLRQDIDTIAAAAHSIREGAQVLNNPSGTAGALVNTLSGAGLFGVILNPSLLVGTGTGVGAATIGAKLLTNPKAVRWLAQSTKLQPAQYPAHLARLSGLAIREPELREDIQEFLGLIEQAAEQEKSQERLEQGF